MAHSMHFVSLILPAAFLTMPSGAAAQAGPASRPAAMCLPPGATAPLPCGTSRAGQAIRLQVATTSLPTGPIELLFTEDATAGQAPRRASVTIAPIISRDGGYDVTVPRELCAGGQARTGSFEIQHLMSTLSEARPTGRSLGTLTVAC